MYCVFAIPTITGNLGSCITQSWVAWGLTYTKTDSRDFLKLSIPNMYIVALTFLTMGGLGAEWFV